jgi:hypothetical protein
MLRATTKVECKCYPEKSSDPILPAKAFSSTSRPQKSRTKASKGEPNGLINFLTTDKTDKCRLSRPISANEEGAAFIAAFLELFLLPYSGPNL